MFRNLPAVLLTSFMVATFFILHAVEITIPAWLSLRQTQQVINLLVSILSIIIAWILTQRRSKQNQSETAQCLQQGRLSPRELKRRWKIASGTIWMRPTSLFYFTAIAIAVVPLLFGTLSVADEVLRQSQLLSNTSSNTLYNLVNTTLGSNVHGPDGCEQSITNPDCTYDLALGPASSMLVAQSNYNVAGFTFSNSSRTRGISHDLLAEFFSNTSSSRFATEAAHYCVPILGDQMISCVEDKSDTRVKYDFQETVNGMDVYTVTVNPRSLYNDTRERVDYQNGTMVIAQSRIPAERNVTIIAGTGIYADTLSLLHSNTNSTTGVFTAVCTISDVKEPASWQWVKLSYVNNTFHVQLPDTTPATEDHCDSREASGFINLYFTLEGSTRLLNSVDGYSKYLSPYQSTNQDGRSNMTKLKFTLNRLYDVTQTMWSSTNPSASDKSSVKVAVETHHYRIHTTWNAPTILTFSLTVLVLLIGLYQERRWYKQDLPRTDSIDLDMLDPLGIITYSMLNYQQLQSYLGQAPGPQASSKRSLPSLDEQDQRMLHEFQHGRVGGQITRTTSLEYLVAQEQSRRRRGGTWSTWFVREFPHYHGVSMSAFVFSLRNLIDPERRLTIINYGNQWKAFKVRLPRLKSST